MRIISILAILAFSFSASAESDGQKPSASKVADFLLSDTVAECVAELKEKTSRYEVFANSDGMDTNEPTGEGKNKEQVTKLVFSIIKDGDLIVGSATISIVEKFRPQFGIEGLGASIPYVDSCSVSF